MSFDIRSYVRNADDPNLKETYEAINNLVNIAGHVTIEDLFAKDHDDFPADVWGAIQKAKPFGFLAFQNNSCCSGGKCRPSARGWCSETNKRTCSAASDSCSASSMSLLPASEWADTKQSVRGIPIDQLVQISVNTAPALGHQQASRIVRETAVLLSHAIAPALVSALGTEEVHRALSGTSVEVHFLRL